MPVIVSDALKSVVPFNTYSIGLVVVIILAFAPLVPPVISSPLVNVPVIVPTASSGAIASVDVSSESNTA